MGRSKPNDCAVFNVKISKLVKEITVMAFQP